MEKAYKVLIRLESGLLVGAGNIPKGLRCFYREEGINIPRIPFSRFFVFKILDRAKHFLKFQQVYDLENNCFEIWEVKVPTLYHTVGIRFPNIWSWYSNSEETERKIEYLYKFWIKESQFIEQLSYGQIDENVYTADTIELVKKVE